MKIFEKFNLNKKEEKKEEAKEVKPLHTEAIVTLREIKETSPGRLRLFFREGKKKQDFVLKIASKEEELKPVLKALTAKKYKEEYEAEKANIEKQKEEVSKPFLAEIASLKIENKEEKEKVVKNIQAVLKEELKKIPEPVSAEQRFEENYKDLEESELIGCSLKVIARDIENNGKITKLIQSFAEVN